MSSISPRTSRSPRPSRATKGPAGDRTPKAARPEAHARPRTASRAASPKKPAGNDKLPSKGRQQANEPQTTSALLQGVAGPSVGTAGTASLASSLTLLGQNVQAGLGDAWSAISQGADSIRSLGEKKPADSDAREIGGTHASGEGPASPIDDLSSEESPLDKWKRIPRHLRLFVAPQETSTFEVSTEDDRGTALRIGEPKKINSWFVVGPKAVWHGSHWEDLQTISEEHLERLAKGEELPPPLNVHGVNRGDNYRDLVINFLDFIGDVQTTWKHPSFMQAVKFAQKMDSGKDEPGLMKSLFENLADSYAVSPAILDNPKLELHATIRQQRNLNARLLSTLESLGAAPEFGTALEAHGKDTEETATFLQDFYNEAQPKFSLLGRDRPVSQRLKNLKESERKLKDALVKSAATQNMWPLFPPTQQMSRNEILTFMIGRYKQLSMLDPFPVANSMLVTYQRMLRRAENLVDARRKSQQPVETSELGDELVLLWVESELILHGALMAEDVDKLSTQNAILDRLPWPDTSSILRYVRSQYQRLVELGPEVGNAANWYAGVPKLIEALADKLAREPDASSRKRIAFKMHDMVTRTNAMLLHRLPKQWSKVKAPAALPIVFPNPLDVIDLLKLRYQSLAELNRPDVFETQRVFYKQALDAAQKLAKKKPDDIARLRAIFKKAETGLLDESFVDYLKLNGRSLEIL
jgi:hypothetical protein